MTFLNASNNDISFTGITIQHQLSFVNTITHILLCFFVLDSVYHKTLIKFPISPAFFNFVKFALYFCQIYVYNEMQDDN